MTIDNTTIRFRYEQVLTQRIQAYANVPVDITEEDHIREWLIDNPGEWQAETVIDEDVIEVEYGSVDLAP